MLRFLDHGEESAMIGPWAASGTRFEVRPGPRSCQELTNWEYSEEGPAAKAIRAISSDSEKDMRGYALFNTC